jgi:hypothetical protein
MTCLLASLPVKVSAWGEEGHRIVAGIAENYLKSHSPKALAKAKELLGSKSLIDVATFPDEVRNNRPYTKNWHFVDIPLHEDNYDPPRDCKSTPKGDCAVQAFDRFTAILTDKTEDPCIRAEALKFIVHIVGDIHQPLHNVDDKDAGGNGKIVKFFDLQGFHGGPPNLHEVWDSGIIQHSGQSIDAFVSNLSANLNPADDPDIDKDVKIWVLASHKLAVEAYGRLPEPNDKEVFVLDKDTTYFDIGLKVVNDQLRKAGLRLGRALEKALGQSS